MPDLKSINASQLKTVFADQQTADLTPMIDGQRSIRTKHERRRFLTARNTKRAADQIGTLPEPGEALHLLIEPNAFAMFDLVPAVLELAGGTADELLLATLGINSRSVQALEELFSAGRILKSALLVSHYFSRVDKGEFAEAVEVFAKHGFPIKEARSHAKIIALKIGSQHIVIESSGNLRSCRAVEQATLFDDSELYQWHRAWMLEMLEGNQ